MRLIDNLVPVGGQVMAHDAKYRKAKWLVPYISRLDNWQTRLYDVSNEGLLYAKKIASQPSPASLRAARRSLLKSRLQPVELAAAILPSSFCGLVCRMVPSKLFFWLYAGAKTDVEAGGGSQSNA